MFLSLRLRGDAKASEENTLIGAGRKQIGSMFLTSSRIVDKGECDDD